MFMLRPYSSDSLRISSVSWVGPASSTSFKNSITFFCDTLSLLLGGSANFRGLLFFGVDDGGAAAEPTTDGENIPRFFFFAIFLFPSFKVKSSESSLESRPEYLVNSSKFSLVVSTFVRSLLSPGSQKRVLNFQFPLFCPGIDTVDA